MAKKNSWEPGHSGNPNGRPKLELVDKRTGEKISRSDYRLVWLRRYNKTALALARTGLTELARIMKESPNDMARIAAIKEVNNRAMGESRRHLDVTGSVQHDVQHSYVDFLKAIQDEAQVFDREGEAIANAAPTVIEADFSEAPVGDDDKPE